MPTIRQLFFIISATLLFVNKPVMAQKQWAPVGYAGFSAPGIEYTSLAIDNNGTPYVAYKDDGNGRYKAAVKKYDGSSWVTVGNPNFSAGYVEYVCITFDNNDTPYVAYRDMAYGGRLTVMKYDGTNWVVVGSPGCSAYPAYYISIVIGNNGIPYAVYKDGWAAHGYNLIIMKYNGINWVAVGAPAGIAYGGINFPSLAVDNNGTPYVAYKDYGSQAKTTVRKYDGTDWVAVGGSTGISAGDIDYTSLTIDNNGNPYVAYRDNSNGSKATVMKYDGTGWVTVGNAAGFSAGIIDYTSLTMDNNGTPYLAYRDNANGYKVTVMKYDGTKWGAVGGAGLSAGVGNFPSLAIGNNAVPYVAYVDNAYGNRATVMKYDDCPPEQKVSICALFTETATGNNMVVWDSSSISFVDSYRVFREDNGSYTPLGAVAGSVNSFTDLTATPSANSYKYKLTLLDSCGRETDIDSVSAHKTIRLVFNYLIDNKASITWNSYEGIFNPVYTVKRSDNGAPFTAITSFVISGTDTTYLDANPPSGQNRYRIDIALVNPCNAGATSYNNITSNTVTSWKTGINDIGNNRKILLLPNPTDNMLRIDAFESIVKIEVFSLTGKKLLSEKRIGNKNAIINVASLPSGMYLLRVNNLHHATFIRR